MTAEKGNPNADLDQHLKYLKLPFMRQQHQDLAKQAANKHWAHVHYLEKLALDEREYLVAYLDKWNEFARSS